MSASKSIHATASSILTASSVPNCAGRCFPQMTSRSGIRWDELPADLAARAEYDRTVKDLYTSYRICADCLYTGQKVRAAGRVGARAE